MLQVGVGTIAQAPKGKLLRNVIKLPTTQIKKLKAKGLTIKDFVSISRIFTKKDMSLIVGRTLSKKKDIIDFVGLIKATSGKTLDSFSVGKQQLFRTALKDVVGVATASTQIGGKIIPKLSPTAKNLIVRSTGIAIVKAKVIAKPIVIPTVKLKPITQKQKQILITETKQITIIEKKVKQKQRVLTKQTQKITQKQKILSREKQTQAVKQKQKQLTKQKQRQALKQKQLLKQRQALKQKQQLLLKQISVRVPVKVFVPRVKIPVGLIKKKKKKIRRKRKPVRPQSFEVWARPLKKRGQKRQPKLIKVSKVPLSKKRAQDLRNYITDTSLGRTARIKLSRGKPTTPKLKVPKGYARRTSKKFRRYRIVKGKKVPLVKGRVIERGKFLLDTRPEKQQISLKRRIAQLSKPPKRKVVRRTPVKRKKSPVRSRRPIRKATKRRRISRRTGGIFGTPSRRKIPQLSKSRRPSPKSPKRKTIKRRKVSRDKGIFG